MLSLIVYDSKSVMVSGPRICVMEGHIQRTRPGRPVYLQSSLASAEDRADYSSICKRLCRLVDFALSS